MCLFQREKTILKEVIGYAVKVKDKKNNLYYGPFYYDFLAKEPFSIKIDETKGEYETQKGIKPNKKTKKQGVFGFHVFKNLEEAKRYARFNFAYEPTNDMEIVVCKTILYGKIYQGILHTIDSPYDSPYKDVEEENYCGVFLDAYEGEHCMILPDEEEYLIM